VEAKDASALSMAADKLVVYSLDFTKSRIGCCCTCAVTINAADQRPSSTR